MIAPARAENAPDDSVGLNTEGLSSDGDCFRIQPGLSFGSPDETTAEGDK